MSNHHFLKWNRKHKNDPERHHRGEAHPLMELHRGMSHLFDDIFHRFDLNTLQFPDLMSRAFSPRITLTEDEKAYHVIAELPGMEEKNIELMLEENTLVLKGEKKEESEHEGKDYYRQERSFGSFRRVIDIPGEVDGEKIEATFEKGILKIILPKVPEDPDKVKKIEIKVK